MPRPEFIQADMFKLSENKRFAQDNRFDLVAAGFWFSHQPKEKMAELFELLLSLVKPDGKIWLIDNNPPAERSTKEKHPGNNSVRTDPQGNSYKKRYLDDGAEFVILKNYFSREELIKIISPFVSIESLIHNEYYWSVVLGPLTDPE